MKTVFSVSLLAAALAAVPCCAATAAATAAVRPVLKPVPKPAARPAPGPVMDAMQSLLREMQANEDPLSPLPLQLDRAAAFRPTPDTAAKLRAVFGTEKPYSIERQSAGAGRLAYRARLQPLHYAGAAGARTDWDEALLDLDMDAAGKTLDLAGRWNTLSTEDALMRMTAQGMTLSGHQQRSEAGLWFGDIALRVASVRSEMKREGVAVTMDDLRFGWRTVEQPKSVDFIFSNRIGAIGAAGEKIEDLHFDMRLTNVDKDAMLALQAAGRRQREQGKPGTPEQELAAMKPLFRDFGRAVIARGTALEIDEISARYRGNKASISGRVALVGAVEADLDDIKAFAKKIVASFEIRVPVAMVRDIAGVVAARQAKQQGTVGDGMGPAQMGQTMTDIVVGKLVGGGYARLENDVLVSNVEFRDGALTANGKPVALAPQVKPMAPPPVTSQRSSLPANALQARRIDDSCRLPDFPAEVLDRDKALYAVFSFRVAPDGKVENVRVTTTSGHPGWDRAMAAALGGCRYIPALQDGKPIGLQIDWNVMRARGGPRSPVPSP